MGYYGFSQGWKSFHTTVVYMINKGYYMAAWGYEFYLLVLKVSLTSERNERVRDMIFLVKEKILVFIAVSI